MRKVAGFFLVIVMLIVSVNFITSCTEDEDPGEYYMRFKANGNLIEYTNQLGLAASFSHRENQPVAINSGWNDDRSNFSFLLYDMAAIHENTYSASSFSKMSNVGVFIFHKETTSGADFSSRVNSDHDARITIT